MQTDRGATVAAVAGMLLIAGVLALLIQLMPSGGPLSYRGQPETPQNLTGNQTQASGNPPSSNATPLTVDEVLNALTDQGKRTQKEGYGEQFLKNLSTDPIVGLTLALVFLACVQLWIYQGEINDTRLIERAYVDIAHRGWLEFHEPEGIWLTVGVKNCGRTPADVLGGVIGFVFAEDSQLPDWSTLTQVALTPAFLVPDKRMEFRTMIFNIPQERIDRATMTSIELDGPDPMEMWMIGYVDYRDKFGREHRVGYGRRYAPQTVTTAAGEVARGQLIFDQTTAAMNYDRPLLPNDDRPYMRHPRRQQQPHP